jgi:Tfp pilus assembly protein PilF
MYFNVKWAPLRGFYSKNYKYVSLPIPELYDLTRDPKETKNLCSDKRLCDQWAALFSSFSKPFVQTTIARAPVDAETAEQLRALGYVSGPSSVDPKKTFGVKDDPKNLIAVHNRLDQAMTYYTNRDDSKALAILQRIVQERPDYSIAYLHMSYIQNERGFPGQAVETLRSGIRNGVSGPDIEAKLGLYLYEAGNPAEAIQHLKLALKEDPKDLDNLNYLGMAYTAQGNFAEAESTFRKGLAIDPSDAMTQNNLGILYLNQKKLILAEKSFRTAIAANPHLASSYNGLGVVYASQQKWDEAIKNWSRAVQENNKNFDAMLNLGYAYLQKKDRTKALQTLQSFANNAPATRYAADLAKVRSLIQQLQ